MEPALAYPWEREPEPPEPAPYPHRKAAKRILIGKNAREGMRHIQATESAVLRSGFPIGFPRVSASGSRLQAYRHRL